MNRNTRAFAVVLACNFQAVTWIFLAFFGARVLDAHYPLARISWQRLALPLARLGIGHGYYMMLRYLLKK